MRLLRNFAVLVLVASCGGKVAFDGFAQSGGDTGTTTSISSVSASSSSAASSASSSSGAACPEFPDIGAHCDLEGQTCPVPFSCCSGTATCLGTWQFTAGGCGQPCLPCGGGLSCGIGALCVTFQNDLGGGAAFECRQDPCPGSTDCDCVQSLCQDHGDSCAQHTPGSVLCTCNAC